MTYLTDADLAERLGVTTAKAIEWRKHYRWPHMKIGRQVRYTEADVLAIEAMHHVKPKRAKAMPGQTALSARRSA